MRTTTLSHTFQPEGPPRPHPNITYQPRHASLPPEHVCTENLMPFLKQLPCIAAIGIAALLIHIGSSTQIGTERVSM